MYRGVDLFKSYIFEMMLFFNNNESIQNSELLSYLDLDFNFNQVTVPYNFDSFLLNESSDSTYFGFLRGLDTDNHSVLSSMASTRFIITGLDVLHSFTILSTGIKVDAIVGRLNEFSTLFLRDGIFFGQCSDFVV
jgi:heme/copper-type cytochrome/quinol oxidase subunit 2